MPYRLYGNKLPYWWELLEFKAGSGADADRTRYLVHAMDALYQLSYGPVRVSGYQRDQGQE